MSDITPARVLFVMDEKELTAEKINKDILDTLNNPYYTKQHKVKALRYILKNKHTLLIIKLKIE